MHIKKPLICFVSMLCMTMVVCAAEGERKWRERNGEGRGDAPPAVFHSEIPVYSGNVMLGRLTDHSITANVMVNHAVTVRIVYGAEGKGEQKTEAFELKPGQPREIVLENLPADSVCHYRLVDAGTNVQLPDSFFSGRFHTRRAPGSSFAFTIQADSHLDGNSSPELYELTLSNALACKPDFHIDLGDTFMTGKIATREEAAKQYLAQRYYLGQIGHSAPVFLVVGNHDGEETFRNGSDGVDGLAVWSCRQRKRYFSNPMPDGFFTGNTVTNLHAGPLQNYYAWEWGDALFAVLDPYWYSKGNKGGSAPWNMTLGKSQYDWLAKTLRASKTKYKFVFIHQLVGGLDKGGRGGSEAAPLYEWGGHEQDGKDAFAVNRPGWEKPIHSLLDENRVTIVFHGHDHFYARQDLDGIIYQLVPQPATRASQNHQAEEYGYKSGTFYPSSGYIRVKVSPVQVVVDYINSLDGPDTRRQGIAIGQTVYSYTCGIDPTQGR